SRGIGIMTFSLPSSAWQRRSGSSASQRVSGISYHVCGTSAKRSFATGGPKRSLGTRICAAPIRQSACQARTSFSVLILTFRGRSLLLQIALHYKVIWMRGVLMDHLISLGSVRPRCRLRRIPLTLAALFVPGVLFVAGLFLVRDHPRFHWLG